jgi:acyl-coenzyme A synthetase/AMP-(fatty) acid ligase
MRRDVDIPDQPWLALYPHGVPALVPVRHRSLADAWAERLAPYKCPRVVHIVAELPKTQTGKIRRNVLRDTGGA